MQEPRHEVYGSVDDVRSVLVRDLHNCWKSACGGLRFAPVSAIDPFALKRFLGKLIVIDVADIDRPRYRLVGTEYARFFDSDFTGLEVADAGFPEAAWAAAMQSGVARDGRPRFGWYEWRSDRGAIYEVEFVLLPFGSAGRVERLLGMDDLSQVMAAQ